MRILVEDTCEGCTDGRVSSEGAPSHECPRCKGTAIEQRSIAFADLFALVSTAAAPGLPLDMRIQQLEQEVMTLKARLRMVDGRANHVGQWQVENELSGYMNGQVHRLEASRLDRLQRMLRWEDLTT